MVKQLYKILPWENLHIIKCSSLIHQSPPNWQGFMAKIVKGGWDCTAIRFPPIIPLNPSSDEAVYSTMVYVLHQAGKLSMYCAALPFDQPLYLRRIGSRRKTDEFQNLTLRVGGFHQFMSFLGTGCKLMEGSRLEDLWATAYARTHSPK